MTGQTMAPIHPGEVLQEEYLTPLGITQHKLAVSIGVPPRRINEIVHGKRGVTADTALRLARFSAPPSDSGSSFCVSDAVLAGPGSEWRCSDGVDLVKV